MVGLLVVVVRPARARAMLPVAAVLAGALAITALVDLARGEVPLMGETSHLPELISVLLLWLLAVPAPSGEILAVLLAGLEGGGAGCPGATEAACDGNTEPHPAVDR